MARTTVHPLIALPIPGSSGGARAFPPNPSRTTPAHLPSFGALAHMAIPAQRRLNPRETRRFGSGREAHIIPDLTQIQTESYAAFLQEEALVDKRKDHGLESVLKEIFPIESYDKQIKLEYLHYELGKPRYTPEECRQLRLTYGKPFR